jgi:hypothetical protein
MQGTTYLSVKYLFPAAIVAGLVTGGIMVGFESSWLVSWLRVVPWWGWVFVGPLAVALTLAVVARLVPASWLKGHAPGPKADPVRRPEPIAAAGGRRSFHRRSAPR